MRVYLAGPMMGNGDHNYPAFREAAENLRARIGYTVISPVELDEEDGFEPNGTCTPEMYRDFLSRDIDAIAEDGIDAIVLLPGWRESKGARAELAFAQAIGAEPLEYVPREKRYYKDYGFTITPLTPKAEKESVLIEAERLINSDRGEAYGHPYDDFTRQAKVMSAVLGVEVRANQVPLLMIAVKLSRLVETPNHRDSAVDIAGYAGCWEKVVDRQRELGEG